MIWLFWISVAVIAYCYFGYPAWLWLRRRWRRLPVKRAAFCPPISVVMVVRNEGATLRHKLQNLFALNYATPPQIVVVSDGSQDDTNQILAEFQQEFGVRAIILPQPAGKASALNEAIKVATGDIVVFTDARQKLESGAVQLLMENFSDPAVGCASGELLLGDPDAGEYSQGVGLYWRIEKAIREMESSSGSVVGATGAFYAARRNLLVPVPSETILDDVYIPMHVVRQGARVVFDSRAHAWDVANQGTGREFSRKVRTLTGNYQLVQLASWLLSGRNPIRFEFVSHKLFRLLVPFALASALAACVFLHASLYRIALVLQLAFYVLALFSMLQHGRGILARAADAAFTFLLLNVAALVAFGKFVSGRKPVWTR